LKTKKEKHSIKKGSFKKEKKKPGEPKKAGAGEVEKKKRRIKEGQSEGENMTLEKKNPNRGKGSPGTIINTKGGKEQKYSES